MRLHKGICISVSIVFVTIALIGFKTNLHKPVMAEVDEFGEQSPYVHNQQCRWPPWNVQEIAQGSTYNITLCVTLDPHYPLKKASKRYPLTSLFRLSGPRRKVSFEDLSKLPRRYWRRVKYPDIYQTYPQDVPLRDLVADIKAGRPVSILPEYNFPLQILRTSNSICSPNSQHDLVIVVKSAVLAWDMRASFREFVREQKARHQNLKIGVIFSVGLPRQHGGRGFTREGHPITLKGRIGELSDFFDGKAAQTMEYVLHEIAHYDDILLGDYEDTYFNLTWKTVTNLRWLSAFCGQRNGDVFLVLDDDHKVNFTYLEILLKTLQPVVKRQSIFGLIGRRDPAYRMPNAKRFLSYREFPWDIMAPYPRGFGQLYGAGIIDDLAIGSAYTRYNYAPEDVYLGMLAMKLGIRLQNLKDMYDHNDFKARHKTGQPVLVALKNYFDALISLS